MSMNERIVPDELVDMVLRAVLGTTRKSELDLVVRDALERNWDSLVREPIYRVGYDDGYEAGFDEGMDDGYDTGYNDALNS